MNDYFDILGVNENSSQEEIKKAYHKMMKKYHPDNYKGDVKFANEMTRKISMAYEVLSTEKLREEYIRKRTTYCEQSNDMRDYDENRKMERKSKINLIVFIVNNFFEILVVLAVIVCVVSCAVYFLPDEVMLYFQRVNQNIEKFISSFK